MKEFPRWWMPGAALIVIPAVAVLCLSSGATAAAQRPPPALCRYDVRDTASPGWWITPSQGTAHGIGTISCVGVVRGRQLAGSPGRFEWWYSYASGDVPVGGNTCALAGGSGTWDADLPTVDGSHLTLTGPWRATGNFVGVVDGELGGLAVSMAYETYIEPEHADENCVTKPASHGRAIG